jgi:predicted helicase
LLLTTRFARDADFAHVFATRRLPDVIFLSNKSSVNTFAFPRSALQPARAEQKLGAPVSRKVFFAYLYALLHARSYRDRYSAVLRTAFPRVTVPRDRRLFDALADHGDALLQVHMNGGEPTTAANSVGFVDGRDRTLERRAIVESARGAGEWFDLAINARSRFERVPSAAFHLRVGGYAVCPKWLVDRARAGRSLSDDEVCRYIEVLGRAQRTIELMQAIDDTLNAAGGLPGPAF